MFERKYYALQITFRLSPVEIVNFFVNMAEISTQNNKKVDNFNRTESDSYLQRILPSCATKLCTGCVLQSW
jgi:hypothetical protein